jgi:hypothetical protein
LIGYDTISTDEFQGVLDAWAQSVVDGDGDVMTDYRSLSGAAFQRAVRDDPDKWADAAMIAAEDLGYKIDRDWIRSLLADAMEAARKGSIREVLKQEGE